jgi:hypothetical protein
MEGGERNGADGTLWHENGTECRMAQEKQSTDGDGFEGGAPCAAIWHKVCLSNAENNKHTLNMDAARRKDIPPGRRGTTRTSRHAHI